MLFGLHWIWAVALIVLVLIVFGVGKLPNVGEALGRGIAEFRRSSREDETSPPSPPATSNKG
jgi:sec-independent protein translocase protein TatA